MWILDLYSWRIVLLSINSGKIFCYFYRNCASDQMWLVKNQFHIINSKFLSIRTDFYIHYLIIHTMIKFRSYWECKFLNISQKTTSLWIFFYYIHLSPIFMKFSRNANIMKTPIFYEISMTSKVMGDHNMHFNV